MASMNSLSALIKTLRVRKQEHMCHMTPHVPKKYAKCFEAKQLFPRWLFIYSFNE